MFKAKINIWITKIRLKPCFQNRIQLCTLGETRPGKGDAGGCVRPWAPGAAAAAGGGAGGRGGGAQEVSPGGDRTPESGASFRNGGAENSATRAGKRKASWEFLRDDIYEIGSENTQHFCGCGLVRWRRWQSTIRQLCRSSETCITSPWRHCMRSMPVPWEVRFQIKICNQNTPATIIFIIIMLVLVFLDLRKAHEQQKLLLEEDFEKLRLSLQVRFYQQIQFCPFFFFLLGSYYDIGLVW